MLSGSAKKSSLYLALSLVAIFAAVALAIFYTPGFLSAGAISGFAVLGDYSGSAQVYDENTYAQASSDISSQVNSLLNEIKDSMSGVRRNNSGGGSSGAGFSLGNLLANKADDFKKTSPADISPSPLISLKEEPSLVQTHFGIDERELPYFLEKKSLRKEQCAGCQETFIDISAIEPAVQAQERAAAGDEDSKKKLKGEFSRSGNIQKRIIVKVNGGKDSIISAVAEIKSLGGQVKFATVVGGVVAAEIPENLAFTLSSNPDVNSIWGDSQVQFLLVDSLLQINAVFPEGYFYTGKDVRVAVIDTGIDFSHSMLSGKVTAAADFSGEGSVLDLHGHGTHIAGIIAGTNSNGGAFDGVAPGALLINAKALNKNGRGTVSSIIQAINFSLNPDGNIYTDDGARVINLSFGAIGDFEGSPLESAISDAQLAGAIVVVSSGNCGAKSPSLSCGGYTGLTFPGSAAQAFTVGAVDENNFPAPFSSGGFVDGYGYKPDIVAPGVNITSSWIGDKISNQSGTSMSAAFVSGAAATLLEKNPLLSPQELKVALTLGTKDLGVIGKDELYGFGLLDLNKSLENIDLVRSSTVALGSTPLHFTLGEDSRPFEAIARLYNSTSQKVNVRDYVAPAWLRVSYATEIPAGSSAPIMLFVDQKTLGLGVHSGELLIAADDYIISQPIELEVISGSADANSTEFEIEISRPVSVTVQGADPSGRVARGNTITLTAKYANPTFDSSFYSGTLQITGPSSYVCDTAWQKYYQVASTGKQVEFSYAVPVNAPLGNYSVKSNSWISCSGQEYDGACHVQNSYSCIKPDFTSEFSVSNIFTVVDSCTSGACCNLTYNTFLPTTSVCNAQKASEFGCPNGTARGSDVYIRHLKQFCQGNASTCSGATAFGEWEKYTDCDSPQMCNAPTGSCITDPIECRTASDCGQDGWADEPFCSAGNVARNYKTYACADANTVQSSCTSSVAPKLYATCSGGTECLSGSCITKGKDECLSEQVGTSWCETATVQTCYFDGESHSYKKKYETCGLGVCTQNGSVAYCDNSQKQFSIEVERAPNGMAIFKQPGDKLKLNIVSKLDGGQQVLLQFNADALEALSADCSSGSTKTLSQGDNFCYYHVKNTAPRKPYAYTVSKGVSYSSRTINVVLPQTIIVTDSEKLRERFPNEYWRVSGLMQKLYEQAFKNQGVVYDLSQYRAEIGAAHPFGPFNSYKETLDSATIESVNNYVSAVAGFVKKRCPIEYCKHVEIVGDDYVIPQLRSLLTSYDFQTNQWKEQLVFVDKPYVPGTLKTIGDSNEFFSKYSSVAVVLPDNMNQALRTEIDTLEQTITKKYGVEVANRQEYSESQISCNYYFGHPLQGKTVVLIGTPKTNQAIECLRYAESSGNGFSVEVSPWGGEGTARNYVLIIDTNSPRVVKLASMLLENDLMRNKDFSNAEFFDDALDTCGMIGYIPFVDVVGDVCTVGKDCGHFLSALSGFEKDTGQGMWCSIGGGIAIIIPGLSVKWEKTITKYMEDSDFAKAVGSTGAEWAESIFERFGKKFADEGAEEAKNLAQLAIKGAGKEVIKPGDILLEDKLGEYLSKSRLSNPGINLLEEGGEHQLVKMFKSKNGAIVVGENIVEDTAILTKGSEEIWGYDHIFKYKRPDTRLTRAEEIMQNFSLKNEGEVTGLIQEILEKGKRSIKNPENIEYKKFGTTFYVSMGADQDKVGKIVTIFYD